MPSIKQLFIVSLSMLFYLGGNAQDFYDVSTIQEIKITFAESNWDEILNNILIEGNNDRLLADIEVNGTKIDSVGIRYKGFSTVSTNRDKNPFNIKLDETNNSDFQGYKKIKLSNGFQDPSFLREVLSYRIARNYMPAPKANFARLYINDTYWGLYTNVESIEEDFLENHFGNSHLALFKCNPDELDLNGENSNLALSHGDDPDNYKPFYDRVNGAWWELYLLMKKLQDNPEDIEEILNVDRTLWMHALNYVLVNFDSYIGFSQNYYLYRTTNGQFQPILWDLNQSIGSFRLTDGSEFFEGFDVEQAQRMDPLAHLNSVSVQPRPLMRSLFENDTYRKMYLAHIRTILEEFIDNREYFSLALASHQLIDQSVQEDENKFHSYDDFQDNLENTVTDLVDFPGIADLMDGRSAYFADYPGMDGEPELDPFTTMVSNPTTGELDFSIDVSNADQVWLFYRTEVDQAFQSMEMKNDGSDTYTANLTLGNKVQFYAYAENDEAGAFQPARAAFEFEELNLNEVQEGDLVINEFLASNDASNADENGDFDDWIEIFNTTSNDLSMEGLFLSDDPANLQKWDLPSVTIPAGGYKLIWADEDGADGELHANFKLSAGGESIHFSREDGTILDEVTFGEQTADVSYGRLPNGTGPFTDLSPTPKANNDVTSTNQLSQDLNFRVFPNPASTFIYIALDEIDDYQISILNLNGQVVNETNASAINLSLIHI